MSLTMDSMIFFAFSSAFLSMPEMETIPLSSMSIFAPVSSMMPLMVLPCLPMTSPIFCGSICMVMIFGAYSESSARGAAMASFITPSMMKLRASWALWIASVTMSLVRP